VTLTGETVTNTEAWGGGNGSYVLSAGSPGVGEGGGIYNAAAGMLFVINQSTVTNNRDDLYNLGTASISGDSTVGVTGP
jgi:hypothetical protein